MACVQRVLRSTSETVYTMARCKIFYTVTMLNCVVSASVAGRQSSLHCVVLNFCCLSSFAHQSSGMTPFVMTPPRHRPLTSHQQQQQPQRRTPVTQSTHGRRSAAPADIYAEKLPGHGRPSDQIRLRLPILTRTHETIQRRLHKSSRCLNICRLPISVA